MAKYNIPLYLSGFIICVACLASCGKDPKAYSIKGQLDNIQGDYFYMSHEVGDSIIVDTIRVQEDGKFEFEGKLDTLTELSLYLNQNIKSAYILADKGLEISIKGDALMPDLIAVKGGDVNNNLSAFKEENKDLLLTRANILNKAEKQNKINDSLVVKDYVVELKNINFELSNVAASYVKANPDKIASVMLINTFFKDESSIPRLDECLSLLKGKAADFPLTSELKFFRDKVKASTVGAIAPNFLLKDVSGKDVQLVDYKGSYLFLSFVSTTCDVCSLEVKDAINVYGQLKKLKQKVDFLTIVKDIEELPVDSIGIGVKWKLLPVEGGWSEKTFDKYYIRQIPYNILISPTGIILERDIPALKLAEKLKEYTDQKENSVN